MAASLGVFSSFLAVESASRTKSSSFSPGVHLVPFSSGVNLPSVRIVTTAAASKPATAATGKGEPKGIMKPRRLSPEMQEFLGGVSEIARTQAIKEIWAYIKQHNLQDPQNKKVIVCDEKLKIIFAGKEKVGFLDVGKLISPHFL